MCGITGFNWSDEHLVDKMTESIRHRGPDDMGCLVDENISLGHCRLSVIDISQKGHQPMSFEHLVISYNGEVYNFKELREQLVSKGYSFNSETDTEVVLKSYHCWGSKCVDKFNGMWAFCIYDKSTGMVFLSRDRFGIKPLYYYFDGDRFIFASELKAIRQCGVKMRINSDGLNSFFFQKYIGGDMTIFENCYKLRASENLLFDIGRKHIDRTQYYNLEQHIEGFKQKPVKERLEEIEGILTDAVKSRLIADVPVGAFLSGGVDSSLISAIIAGDKRNFDTFSIGFKDTSYDEVEYSRQVSRHIDTNHHVEYADIDEEMIKHVITNMDEPFGDASIIPTYLLSKITRQKVTVSLSGDGGDEVFGGYDSYQAYNLARYIPSPLVKLVKPLVNLFPPSEKKLGAGFKLKKFINDYVDGTEQRHLSWMASFGEAERSELLNDRFVPMDSFSRFSGAEGLLSVQLNDIYNYMAEDILKKVDLASMLNSLEVRVPFLDHRLVAMVLSLPQQYKIRMFRTKWLLKKIATAHLPSQIVHRKKSGFTVPTSRWIRESEFIRDLITNRRYYDNQLLNYDYVKKLFDNHLDRKEDNARKLWLVFVFNYWHSKLFDSSN